MDLNSVFIIATIFIGVLLLISTLLAIDYATEGRKKNESKKISKKGRKKGKKKTLPKKRV